MIVRMHEWLARLATASNALPVLAQHAGHAEPHDVALLLGALACFVFGLLRRRYIDVM